MRTLSFHEALDSLIKQASADQIPGGVGDNTSPEDVDQEELRKGRKHEREHTHNDQVAEEIALDHLTEDPRYYTKLLAKSASKLRVEPRDKPGYVVGKGDSMASSGPAPGQKTAFEAALRKIASDLEMPMTGASTRFLHNPESGVAPEGGMVLGKLHRICEMAQMLMGILEANDQLPPWVQDHVSVAYENLDQVFGYIEPKSHMGGGD